MEAVDLFMSSRKIGMVIIDGCFNYTSETKLKDLSLVIGEAYYSEIFEGKSDYNVKHKGDFISKFNLNDSTTYLKHRDVLTEDEIVRILNLCEQYTKLFANVNDNLEKMVKQYKDKITNEQ